LVGTVAAIITVIITLLGVRAAWVFLVDIPASRKQRSAFTTTTTRKKAMVRTVIVLGSGGHTAEMLHLTHHLDPVLYERTYIKAATDTTSQQRLDATDKAAVYSIPRSREVGQSYVSSIRTTARAILYCFQLVARLQPDLVLCNGPGTCVPVCLATLFFRVVGWMPACRIVFVESYCRTETLSVTGRMLYHAADLFVVHWEPLTHSYPNTVLVSTFVAENAKQDATART
jgi:beta-1,4-N-acetylglucosaminyltransferase